MIESESPGEDCWDRMRNLGEALSKLLLTPRALARLAIFEEDFGDDMDSDEMEELEEDLMNYNKEFGDKDTDKDTDGEESKVLFPHLRKIIIRFPNASREATEGEYGPQPLTYKDFRKDHHLLRLKKFINGAKLKCFQLEDLRDFKHPGKPAASEGDGENDSAEEDNSEDDSNADPYDVETKPHGLMDDGAPRFSIFTSYLNMCLRVVKCQDETAVDHQDKNGRGEGWEIYKAKETWTATGDYLTWTAPKFKKKSKASGT